MNGQQQASGWYPAPDQPGQQRYWDGTTWTDNYAPLPQAPMPGPPAKKGGAKKLLIPLIACLGLAFVLVIGVAALGGDSDDEDAGSNDDSGETTDAPSETSDAGEDVYSVGQTGKSSDLEITVLSVEDPYISENQFIEPEAGRRFVGVEMELTNTGDDTVSFSSLLSIEVSDKSGGAWDVTFVDSSQPDIGGDIPAGSTRNGWVYLSVGEDATDLLMRVKGSITATGSLFNLG